MNKKRTLEEMPDVLLAEDVMEILQISRVKVYKLLKSGAIPSVRIGKNYRIPKKMLLSFLIPECYNLSVGDSPAHLKGGADNE